MNPTLLEIENLRISFQTRTRLVEAVRGVSFSLGREKLGIVGESGSGKSQTGRAILGLTPAPGKVEAQKLIFDGIDLNRASRETWRKLRGDRISMVMQDADVSVRASFKFSLAPWSIRCACCLRARARSTLCFALVCAFIKTQTVIATCTVLGHLHLCCSEVIDSNTLHHFVH